jgi:hypothetical protein
MGASPKRLHVCTFNVDRYHVNDQIRALTDMLAPHASVTVTDTLVPDVDTLLIENFNAFQIEEVRRHRTQSRGRLFLLLTEHFELDAGGGLLLNDQAWSAKREYIPDLYLRFLSVVKLSSMIDGFVVLYGAPQPCKLQTVFPAMPIFDLAQWQHFQMEEAAAKEYDFCFIGRETRYRKSVIAQLQTRFSVYSGTGLSDDERAAIIRRSRFTLTIPQHEGWTNLSPMRVVASAREGARVINVAEPDGERFPYVSTMALPDLLSMTIEDVGTRWAAPGGQASGAEAGASDLEHFTRWLS